MFEMLDHNGPGHFGSSFALGFSEPNFVKKPTHPHQGRGSWRPNPRRSQTSSRRTWPSCPGSFGRIGIRHGGRPGGSLGHPSGGEGEPRDLGFRDGENGFNVQTSAFTAMRLLQAVRVAASGLGGQPRGSPGGPGGPDEGAPGGPV